MAKTDWQEIKLEICSKLNIVEEYAQFPGFRPDGRPRSSGWLACYAFNRDERNPSAAINIETGVYVDSASGETLNFFDAVGKYGGSPALADFDACLKHFADKAGVKVTGFKQSNRPDQKLGFQDWTPGNRMQGRAWCERKGVTFRSALMAGARVASYPAYVKGGKWNPGRNKCIVFPAYGEQLASDEPTAHVAFHISKPHVELAPARGSKEPRFERFASVGPTTGTLMNRSALGGGRESIKLVIKTGGPSDMLAAMGLIEHESIAVVTNASGESGHVPPWVFGAFPNAYWLIIHDQDFTGWLGAKRWLAQAAAVGRPAGTLRLPAKLEPKHGKDFRDMVAALASQFAG